MADAETHDENQATGTATAPEGQATSNAEKTGQEPDYQAEAEKWKALARKHETASKVNADKAKQFDQWQESQKTEQQKADEAATQLRSELDQARAEAALATAALNHGLSTDDLELIAGGTPEQIEARAERLAERLKAGHQTTSAPDPLLGREQQPTGSGDWLRDQFSNR